MKENVIAYQRLVNQQIAGTDFKSPIDIVRWMGAIQAQDYAMARWALGARLPGATDRSILAAIDQGDIIRTHVLRPTWHLAPAEDIRWMLQLTAPRIKAVLPPRHRELELSADFLSKCLDAIEKTLGGKHMTRAALIRELERKHLDMSGQRATHVMFWAELHCIVCSGAMEGKQQTYALFGERIRKSKTLSRDESLAVLARRYFLSHGPATLHDFAWWSGLSVSEARNGLEMVKNDLQTEKTGSQVFWFAPGSKAGRSNNSVYFLPAYDEFLISYRDRTAALSLTDHPRAVSVNGIFHPTIIYKGQVVGLWKKTAAKGTGIVETSYFIKDPERMPRPSQLKKGIDRLGKFIGHELVISDQRNND